MRRLPSALLVSKVSTTLLLALIVPTLLVSSFLAPSAFGQGSKRISIYDPIKENDKDNPAKRDEWMMRGRTAPKGQNASALHYRAYQQKMAMRAQRAAMAAKSGNGLAPQTGTPWVPLGPAPLTSDQNFFGEVTGRSTAIAIDPSDTTGATVYIAGASGGVWKSTNANAAVAANVTWTPVTDQQASLVNGALSVKSDGSVVLVGTGEPNNAIDSYYGQGILRSADHGATWTLASSSDSGAHSFAGIGFTKFAWLPSSNTVVAAAADAFKGDQYNLVQGSSNLGMFLSTDGGQTWTFQGATDGSLPFYSATDVTYNAAAGKFFASFQYHGIYSSSNGKNWARLSTQPSSILTLANCPTATNSGTCPLFRGQITTVPGRNEMYFWFVDGNDGDHGIWQSLDGGAMWKQIDETGLTVCGDSNGCGTQQAFYNLEISAVANGTGTDIYTGAVNLFKCNLASGATKCSALDPALGQSWLNLTHVYGACTIANVHPDEHGMDFMVVGGKDIMYFGNDGGVYRALDGYTDLIYGSCSSAGTNSFDNLNTKMGSMTQFVSFSIHPTDQNTVLGGTQDNGSPASSTATTSSQFITVLGGDGGYNAINPNNVTEWFTSNTDSFIWGCESGIGCSDSLVFPIAQPGANIDQGAFYTPFILDPQSTGEMLIGTCRVWRGPTATQVFSQLSPNFDTDDTSFCNGGEINQVHGLAAGGPKDTNGLSNVVYAVTFGLGPLFGFGTGGEVWVTTNAATTQMTDVTGTIINPNNYALSSVAMDNSDTTGKTAYVGVMGFNTSHVWKTTNAGTSWTDFSGNLPDSPVDDLLVDSAAGQIYVATDIGVFVSSTSSASWSEVGTPSTPGGPSGYLPNVPTSAIRMFSSGGVKKLRVSTYGRGIWEYNLQAQSFTLAAAPTSVSIAQGSTGTSTITVTPVNGFTGSVTFAASGLPTGVTAAFNPTASTTSSVMTLTVTGAAAPGTSTVTVTGTSGSLTATTTVSLTVTAGPSFTLTAAPTSVSIAQGANGTSTITVVPANGFTGTVSFAASGLPTGVTAAFNPTSSTTSSVLTLTVGASAATGTSTITITGTSGSLTATTTVSLTVTTGPGFTLAANPATLTITPTLAGGTSTITVTDVGGFTGNVTLTATGLPTGVTAAFVPNPTGTTSVVTLTAAAGATQGPATVTIKGTSGALMATTTIALTVTAAPNFTLSAPNASVTEGTTDAGRAVTITPTNGFTGSVTLSATGLPTGVTANFSPNPATTTSTLTFVLSPTAVAGTTTVTIHGASGSLNNTATLSLTVVQNFTAIFTTTPPSANPGQNTSATMKLTTDDGKPFTSNVTFTCPTSLPTGVTCSLPATITAGTASPQSVTITINTAGPFSGAAGAAHREPKLRSQNQRMWLPLGLPLAAIMLVGLVGKRVPRLYQILGLCLVVAFAGFLVACGSGSSNPSIVTVTPSTVSSLWPNLAGAPAQTQQFSASVTNATDQSVTWAVSGGAANGTIDANGLYTAPATLPNPNSAITVTATSTHSTTPGSATVNLQTPTPAQNNQAVAVTVTEGSVSNTANFILNVN